MRLGVTFFLFTIGFATVTFSQVPGEGAEDWIDLIKENSKVETVAGNWEIENGALKTDGEGASRVMLPVRPTGDYDFRVTFTRESGSASISLFFTQGEQGQAGFEVDAWNRGLAGIQQIGGRGIPDNGTSTNNRLTNGQKHIMQVSVRGNAMRAYFDGKQVATHEGDGSGLSLLNLWRLPNQQALGIGAYNSPATFHKIEIRKAGSDGFVALNSAAPSQPETPPTTTNTTPPSDAPAEGSAKGKKVLLVIANQDFFYREYAHPREELERAGIEVTVAAGTRSTCRPHRGSGYPNGDGSVEPDIALSQAKAADYDAIMFSGGWGSSAYQYAFDGEYRNDVYNGSRSVKRAVNELINDFVEQDKYVGALCHGVAILAWSRVDGKSLLDGKTVCCYPRDAPAGTDRQRLSAWDSTSNGATVLPSRSVGNSSTDTDDVYVDGKVLTGENDPSSRVFGRTLASLLARNNS